MLIIVAFAISVKQRNRIHYYIRELKKDCKLYTLCYLVLLILQLTIVLFK